MRVASGGYAVIPFDFASKPENFRSESTFSFNYIRDFGVITSVVERVKPFSYYELFDLINRDVALGTLMFAKNPYSGKLVFDGFSGFEGVEFIVILNYSVGCAS